MIVMVMVTLAALEWCGFSNRFQRCLWVEAQELVPKSSSFSSPSSACGSSHLMTMITIMIIMMTMIRMIKMLRRHSPGSVVSVLTARLQVKVIQTPVL